ncbi:hypothetical protein [Cognataquiflexum aquatile]|uniref:hypothetical protein n=1 Tax=Cognataquiflexum aquatile TaxID=2249427 RepID=UPI000DEBCD8E|nr:hypothetical protein [Cognataquiflexum aquatile]
MNKFSLKVIAVLLLTGLIHPAMAQLKLLKDNASGGRPVIISPFADVEGSPYLLDFQYGSILFFEKDTLPNQVIAFNAYENTLEQRKEDGKFVSFESTKIEGFILNDGNSLRQFRSGYDIPKVGKNIFAEVHVDGKYTFISHHFKIIGDVVSANYGSQKSKSFQDVEQYYIVKDGKVILLKSKSINEIFGQDAAEVSKFVKNHGIDFKNQSEITILIKMINSK